MEVALDPAALGVASLDDAKARCGQLVSRVCACDREADELCERLQAALGLERQGFVGPEGDDESAPGRAGDRDRHTDAAAEPQGAQLGCAGADELVVVRSRGRSGLQNLKRRADLELVDVADLEGTGRLAELADDRRGSRVLEAVKHGCPEAEQRQTSSVTVWKTSSGGALPATRVATRRSAACSAAEPLLLRLGAPLLGEVAGDRNDLAVAARNEPCLPPVRNAVDRELVLDHLHGSGLERALDAGEDGASELGPEGRRGRSGR